MERLGRRRGKLGEAAEADELVNSSMQANEDRRSRSPTGRFRYGKCALGGARLAGRKSRLLSAIRSHTALS